MAAGITVYSLFISLPFWEAETQSPVGRLLQGSTVVIGGTEVIGTKFECFPSFGLIC